MFRSEQNAPTSSVAALAAWCVAQFNRLANAWSDAESVTLRVLHAAPERIRPGMVIYASSTLAAQPGFGSGEGIYRRNAANNSWQFVG